MKLLVFLATAKSCWYTVNGDINHEYSLARRLGFFLKEDYYAFLVTAGLAETNKKDELVIKSNEWKEMIDGTLARDNMKHMRNVSNSLW